MTNLDSVVVQYLNGEVKVQDSWSTSQTNPVCDSSQDFEVLGWSRNGTSTKVKF